MDLPPGQSYVFQRECMTTYNYQVKNEHQDKCNDIDEAKRKEQLTGGEEVMYVKVDSKCFDGSEDVAVAAHTSQQILKQHDHDVIIKSYEVEDCGLSSQITRQDQHCYAKIETLRGKTPTEIHGQLKEVCGNTTVDRSTVSRWAQRFRTNFVDVKVDRPKISTENISADIIATILDEDRRVSSEELILDHRFNNHRTIRSNVHRILTNVLGKQKGSTLLLAPQELTADVCKKPEPQSPQPIVQSQPIPTMESSQSTSLVKSADRKDQLWCQKIDTEDIAHFLDVDIDMKDADLKYSTPLGSLDSKVLSCLRHKASPGCKENSYSERKLYTQHQYVQTVAEKPFTCLVCGKYFNQASHLQQHSRTHTGERPFTCSLCAGTFTRPSDLKRHMRTHTGEKPYKCSVCSNVFGDVSHLKSHMRTHTGEKPYACPVCAKAFARHSSLKRHMRVHNRHS